MVFLKKEYPEIMRVYKLLQLVCSHHVSPGSVHWSQPGSPTFGNQEGVSFALFLLFLKVNTNSQMESPKVKVAQSCPTLCDPMNSYSPWNSPGQNTGVGSHSLLQGHLPNPGIGAGSPALQADSLLSHQGSLMEGREIVSIGNWTADLSLMDY